MNLHVAPVAPLAPLVLPLLVPPLANFARRSLAPMTPRPPRARGPGQRTLEATGERTVGTSSFLQLSMAFSAYLQLSGTLSTFSNLLQLLHLLRLSPTFSNLL